MDNLQFVGEPEKWFYDNYDYLYGRAINNNFNNIPLRVKVYFVMRILFDEVMNGGFGQYLNNSSIKLSGYLIECTKLIKNKKLIKLIEKFDLLINKSYEELSHEDHIELEKLSNDFYDIDAEYDLYEMLDIYYMTNE